MTTSIRKPQHRWIIGIDPGVNTGFAVWDRKERKLKLIFTTSIHRAMGFIENASFCEGLIESRFVRVEDARKRKWFGKDSNAKMQGAGSVKRDAKIWEDFLTDLGIDFEMVHPQKGGTKMDAERFRKLTGYTGRTSNHARDAAMLVIGM